MLGTFEYGQVVGHVEQPLRNRVVQDQLLHVRKNERSFFALTGVSAQSANVAELVLARTAIRALISVVFEWLWCN